MLILSKRGGLLLTLLLAHPRPPHLSLDLILDPSSVSRLSRTPETLTLALVPYFISRSPEPRKL